MHSVVGNLNETYEASPGSVAQARSRLAQFAARAGATPSQIDAVRLAASEAMTNSVLHAYRGRPGRIHVNAAVASEELWIRISDDGCGLQPRAERPGLGLGLGLISDVSDDFTIVSRATGGTEVRIGFNLMNSAAAPAPAGTEPVHRSNGRRPGLSPAMSVA